MGVVPVDLFQRLLADDAVVCHCVTAGRMAFSVDLHTPLPLHASASFSVHRLAWRRTLVGHFVGVDMAVPLW